MGVDGGICREYGIRRDLCAAALFGVPAVEAVLAAGSIRQSGQLLLGGGQAAAEPFSRLGGRRFPVW